MVCPPWCMPLTSGDLYTGVVQTIEQLDESLFRVQILGTQHTCLVAAPLKINMIFTIYGYHLADAVLQILVPTSTSATIAAKPCDVSSACRLVEVCAGIGGIGVGAERCGFEIHGFLDKNRLAVDTLKHLGRLNVHHGDLLNDEHIQKLHL